MAKKRKKAAKKHAKRTAAKPATHQKTHKKKESNKFLVWAIVVVVIVVLLFLIRGVKKAPEAPVAPVVEPEAPPVEVEEAPPVEEVVEEEMPPTEPGVDYVEEGQLETGEYSRESLIGNPTYEDEALALDLTDEPEKFSNFECVVNEELGMRFISMKVTNMNSDVTYMISPKGVAKGYNTYFMVNGLTDADPGCDVEELAPGESTVCDRIGSENPKFEISEGVNRLTIQTPNDEGKIKPEAAVVNCEEE